MELWCGAGRAQDDQVMHRVLSRWCAYGVAMVCQLQRSASEAMHDTDIRVTSLTQRLTVATTDEKRIECK